MDWQEDMNDGTVRRTDVLRASPPMFESRVLDALSRVHPAVPDPDLRAGDRAAVRVGAVAHAACRWRSGCSLAGYALWTLFEYWLHRIVFHFEPEDGLGARMHWIIHGVHHDHPNDPMRLVMPPAVSIPLGAGVFGADLPARRATTTRPASAPASSPATWSTT